MAIEPISHDQILAQVGQRDTHTGFQTPPIGQQPYYDWLIQSLQLLSDASCGALRVVKDDSSDTAIRIIPGRASVDGTALDVESEVFDLATYNNLMVYVWLEVDNGEPKLKIAASNQDWPVTTHLKLAEVTLETGAITHILDRRFETILKV